MKPPARKESEIQREILRYLQAWGIFAWKAGVGAARAEHKGKARFIRFGEPGQPDIIGMLPTGQFLAIEVKRPGQRPTPLQQEFIRTVNRNNGLAFVSDSVQHTHETLRLSREGEPHAYLGQRQPAPRAE